MPRHATCKCPYSVGALCYDVHCRSTWHHPHNSPLQLQRQRQWARAACCSAAHAGRKAHEDGGQSRPDRRRRAINPRPKKRRRRRQTNKNLGYIRTARQAEAKGRGSHLECACRQAQGSLRSGGRWHHANQLAARLSLSLSLILSQLPRSRRRGGGPPTRCAPRRCR